MSPHIAKYLIFLGISIVVIGILFYIFPNLLKWFGRLPGDIRIERENFKFFFPVTTMILLSLLFTLILNILRKL